FTNYALTGYGLATGTAGQFTPGINVAAGTQINPTAQSWLADTWVRGTPLSLSPVLQQENVRTPVNLSLNAAGIQDSFVSGPLPVRGDLVIGAGATITTDARASVTLSGHTAEILGKVYAPGGSISVSGSGRSDTVFQGVGRTDIALTTVHTGPESVLSTAGKVVLTPDPRGNRTGSVLAGGTISMSGNIAAEKGSVIDVSGATGELDVAPAAIYNSGLSNGSLQGAEVVRTRIDSNAGTINLNGAQQLIVDATLRGNAGGPGTLGGTLNYSSGVFFVSASAPNALTPTTKVTQSGRLIPEGGAVIGQPVPAADGTPLPGMGYFTADTFSGSGLAALSLNGSVFFDGPVSLSAARSLSVASAGVIRANDAVTLSAPAVALGQRFLAPKLAEELLNYSPFLDAGGKFYFPPATGTGSLTVNAKLIDVGNLSLQGIGSANLNAENGDIRGNGTLDIAGTLALRAGQIYPTTGIAFTIAAYDYQSGGSTLPGTVTISGGGQRQLPYSAGGTLNVYASSIHQNGVLRAPAGTINLGWDGTGTAPKDAITNQAVPVTTQLTLGSSSITSVSSVDPVTGAQVVLPYGLNPGGTAWIDPSGLDITRTGPPAKSINLSGVNVDVQEGSALDIRGGGDLYAYRWILGNGGSRDVLNTTTSFAVIPGYAAEYAPYAAFNPAATSLGGDPGYVNNTLTPGDRIYLNGSNGLPAGVYTLLPAHYALLPGAFLVTPRSGTPAGSITQPDKASLVAGYRFNQAAPGGENVLMTNFEVASSAVVRKRSQYEDYLANAFFKQVAVNTESAVPRLPVDAGRLLLQAAQQIAYSGTLKASTPQGVTGARGGLVDISSPVDILVASPGAASTPGTLTLSSADLSAFNAQSLLIGGVRQTGPNGTQVSVTSNSVTVDNADAPLTGQDIILVSNGSLTIAPDAKITQSGTGTAETLVFGNAAVPGSGNGTMLRLSGDPAAGVVRNGITNASGPVLTIGANAGLTGTSLTLDSTAALTLDPAANLLSNAISINSGRISLALDNPGTLQPNSGLVLSGGALS
ncbi:MAG TPA: hypothetical protein VHM91_22230, partial [Verrucomicrobiales bacterium]|nr:hypothetical protein [Verrucomicrobiales bacterium]